MFDQF